MTVFLDKAQPKTWEAAQTFSAAVSEAATELPLNHVSREELESAQVSLGDEAFAAAQWVGVAINTFNRISLLSLHPVRERNADGKIVR